jgi:hypothetical protein
VLARVVGAGVLGNAVGELLGVSDGVCVGVGVGVGVGRRYVGRHVGRGETVDEVWVLVDEVTVTYTFSTTSCVEVTVVGEGFVRNTVVGAWAGTG